MSAVFQKRMIELRANRIRKGEQVGERPRGGPVGEFTALRSCITKDDSGPQPDLNALAMGIKQDLTPRRPVIKADHEQYVSAATGMDGAMARERLMKADATGFPADRTEIDPTGAATAKAPAPAKPEVFDSASFAAKLSALIANAIAAAAAVANTSQTAVAKAQKPSPAEVQAAIEDNKLFLRKGGPAGSVKITKRAVEPDDLTATIRRMFPQAA